MYLNGTILWAPTVMKPEAAFAARVREGLRPFGVDIERIENRVNLGIADCLMGVGPRFVAVELKVVERGLKVALRPHQVAFLTRHASKGRPCFVLVSYKGTKEKPARVLLYRGADAVDLAENGLRVAPLRDWPNRGMPWKELAELMENPDSAG
jgi:hypothetical protein